MVIGEKMEKEVLQRQQLVMGCPRAGVTKYPELGG